MIDEEQLQIAAKEAAEAILQSLPAQEDISYTPSPIFAKKMKKLIFRIEYPILYHCVRSVACLLALVLSGSILLFGISSDVRAAILGWFKQLKEGTHFEYDFEGDNAVDMTGVRYEPGWMPEGFELVQQDEINGVGIIIYLDQQNFIAQITYILNPNVGDVSLLIDGNSPDYEYKKVQVYDNMADLYISRINNATSSIVWSDKNDVLFYISAMLEEDKLIRWAESIIELKKFLISVSQNTSFLRYYN